MRPAETPFPHDSPVRSIEINYPARASWTSGTDYRMVYCFAVSLVAAFCSRRAHGVNV
jgi:hypothetical protein